MSAPLIKICGLRDEASILAATKAGATHVGFVIFHKSPRHVTTEEALHLAAVTPEATRRVALMVDPDDALIDEAVQVIKPHAIQLHGHETPERVAAIRARAGGLFLFKALPVGSAADVAAARAFEDVADSLLFDARPPLNADRPGGHGAVFDWSLLKGVSFKRPWVLSGGLNPENVAEAIRETKAPGVDVSSGVESAPGVKDPARIAAFCAAAASAYGISVLESAL